MYNFGTGLMKCFGADRSQAAPGCRVTAGAGLGRPGGGFAEAE